MPRKKKFRWWALKLVGIIILVFIVQKIVPSATAMLSLKSADVLSRPWIILTSIFLHGDIVHLLYNMFALGLFGLILEKKVGTRIFLIAFFGGGIFANLVAMWFYPDSLGASGAIFAVLGMLALIRPKMIIWVSYMPLPMWLALLGWTIGNLIIALAPTNIGAVAHLSGIGYGIGVGWGWRVHRKKFRQRKTKKSNA